MKVCVWTAPAGVGWILWICASGVSGVVLRTLATRGRKREGPTPQGVGGMERSGRSEGQYRLRPPSKTTALCVGGMERSGRTEGQYTLRPRQATETTKRKVAGCAHGGSQLTRNTVGGSLREARWEAARAKHGGRQLARNTVGGSSCEARWETGRTNTIRRLTAETK